MLSKPSIRHTTLRQIEAFKTVIEAGTIHGAAGLLNVSQPAVSKLIQNFEASLGLRLFERRQGRLFPTTEARMLHSEVERLFLGGQHILKIADEIRTHQIGSLIIGVMPALSMGFIQRVVNNFLRTHPKIKVTLHMLTSAEIITSVATQQLDVGLVSMMSGKDRFGVEIESLIETAAVCIIPRKHRLSEKKFIGAGDLKNERFILVGRGPILRSKIQSILSQQEIEPSICVETSISATACAFVAAGSAIAIVDPFSTEPFTDRLLVKCFRPKIILNFSICFPIGRQRSLLTTAFVESTRSIVQQVVPSLM